MKTRELILTPQNLQKLLRSTGIIQKSEKLYGSKEIVLTVTKGVYTQEQEEFLNTEIEDLELTVRLFNRLERLKVKTMIDLAKRSPEGVKASRRWCQNCTNEVNEMFVKRGMVPIL